MFDAASRKYSDITFQKLDGDEAQTKTLMGQYGVGGYPTLVFLDGGGQVIYNGGAPRQLEDFENLIGQYR